MSTTPETDVRRALEQAAAVPGLSYDPDAVLARGHRVVRRRRYVAVGAAAAATAVVAVVAVQLGTTGPRALPAVPPQVSTSSPAEITGPLSGSTSSDGIRQGRGVDVTVTPRGDGTVSETWTFFSGTTRVGSVSRTVPAPRAGGASFLMPATSGQPGMVYGYVLSGPEGPDEGYVMVQPVTAPSGPGKWDGSSLTLRETRTGATVGSVFAYRIADPEQVVGVTWSRTRPTATEVEWVGDGAALRHGRRAGVDAAVVTVSPRTSMLLWRNGTRFSYGSMTQPVSDPGVLQVTVRPRSTAIAGLENDMALGWVAGPRVTLSSSDPQDSFTVSYGEPVGGRLPFVARSSRPDVEGTVTVTGAGETQTLATWGTRP